MRGHDLLHQLGCLLGFSADAKSAASDAAFQRATERLDRSVDRAAVNGGQHLADSFNAMRRAPRKKRGKP